VRKPDSRPPRATDVARERTQMARRGCDSQHIDDAIDHTNHHHPCAGDGATTQRDGATGRRRDRIQFGATALRIGRPKGYTGPVPGVPLPAGGAALPNPMMANPMLAAMAGMMNPGMGGAGAGVGSLGGGGGMPGLGGMPGAPGVPGLPGAMPGGVPVLAGLPGMAPMMPPRPAMPPPPPQDVLMAMNLPIHIGDDQVRARRRAVWLRLVGVVWLGRLRVPRVRAREVATITSGGARGVPRTAQCRTRTNRACAPTAGAHATEGRKDTLPRLLLQPRSPSASSASCPLTSAIESARARRLRARVRAFVHSCSQVRELLKPFGVLKAFNLLKVRARWGARRDTVVALLVM
jgi:hypothetical protein